MHTSDYGRISACYRMKSEVLYELFMPSRSSTSPTLQMDVVIAAALGTEPIEGVVSLMLFGNVFHNGLISSWHLKKDTLSCGHIMEQLGSLQQIGLQNLFGR